MRLSSVNRFAILSFLCVVILALSMGFALSTLLTRAVSEWEWENTAALARRQAEIAGLEPLFTLPLTPETQGRWKTELSRLFIGLPEVVRVKVWNRDAIVLWSDDSGLIGQRFPDNDELQQALKGNVAVEIKKLGKSEHAQEPPKFTTLAEVYVPIFSPRAHEVVGVIEIYKIPNRLLATIELGRSIIWFISLVGGLALYLVLLPLTRQVYGREVRETTLKANAHRLEQEVAERTQALHRQTERLTRLSGLTQTVTSSLDTQRVFEAVVQGTLQLFHVANVRLWVVEPSTGDSVLSATASAPDLRKEVEHLPTRFPRGHWNVGWVIEHQQPLYTSDLTQGSDPYIAELAKRIGFVSQLAVPLLRGDQALGALVLNTRERREFPAEEQKLVSTFAATAALAIEKARLYEETQRRRCEAEELAQVARMLNERLGVQAVGERIVEGVRRLLNVVVGTVFRLRSDGSLVAVAVSGGEGYAQEVGYVLPPGAGVTGRAVVRGEPVCCADILNDSQIIQTEIHHYLETFGVRALLAIPLRSKGQIIGALGVGDQVGRVFTEADLSLLQAFADQAALALENARLYEETQQHLTRTETLLAVGQAVGSTLDLAEVARRATREVVRILGADMGGAWRFNSTRDTLIPLAGYHVPPELIESFATTSIPSGHPLVEEAAQLKGPIYSSDSQSDSKFFSHPLARLIPHKSLLIFPLLLKGEAMGGLAIAWMREAHRFTPEELRLVQGIAHQAAIAIENSWLYEQAQQTTQELHGLIRAGRAVSSSLKINEVLETIAREAASVMRVTACTLRLLHPDGDRLVWAAGIGFPLELQDDSHLEKSLPGWVATHGEPLTVLNRLTDERSQRPPSWENLGLTSYLGVPVKEADRTIGVLSFLTKDPHPFGDAEIALALSFADQAAIAIKNARLFEETQARLVRMKRLTELSHLVSSTLDLQQVIDFVTEAALDLLDGDLARTWVVDEEAKLLRMAAYRARRGLSFVPPTTHLPLGFGLAGWVVQHKTKRYSSNLLEEPLQVHKEWIKAIGDKVSQIAVPLIVGERALGALILLSKGPRRFSEEEEELLEIFAAKAAAALENSRLYQRNKEALERLRLFGQAIRSIGEAVVITDLEGTTLFVNDAFTKMRGYTEAEVVGKPAMLMDARQDPGEFAGFLNGIIQGGEVQREMYVRRKSGEEFPILLTATPVLDEAGRSVALIGVSRDLSQVKELQDQLIQTEKLAATGQLAAGVAHEINNPLSVILGFSDLALRKRPAEALADDLETIRNEALRAARIIRDLLAFARPTPHERLPLDLNDLLRHTLSLQAYHLSTDQIEVLWRLTEPLPKILADRSQLQQVILNIVLNAHQAMKAAHDRGTLWIETGRDDSQVWATFRDDGPGIASEILPRIFDPFLTTKPIGQGTGLGLSISYGIIQAHGGHLRVESEIGRGATFTILLPVIERETPVSVESLDSVATTVQPLSVLVVDDEPAVAEVLAMMFGQLGHRADIAHSGHEALARLGDGRYDLITLDLKMPRMSGQEVWQALQAMDLPRRPAVLFFTGDIATPEARRFLVDSCQPYLEKPIQLDDLAQKLAGLQGSRFDATPAVHSPR